MPVAVSPAGPCMAWRSNASAKPVSDGASNSARSGSSTPNASRTREINCVASSEWPPRSKKVSACPTRSTWSNSTHSSARRISVAVDGGLNWVSGLPLPCGTWRRRAARSTLPLGVRGKASSRTKAAGSMYSGRRAAEVGAPVAGGSRGAAGRRRGRRRGGRRGRRGSRLDERDGIGDAGQLTQDGFDLAEFDAEAAQLDLLVEAAEDLELAVGEVAGQVAGAVEPRSGRLSDSSHSWAGVARGTKRSAVRSGRPR